MSIADYNNYDTIFDEFSGTPTLGVEENLSAQSSPASDNTGSEGMNYCETEIKSLEDESMYASYPLSK